MDFAPKWIQLCKTDHMKSWLKTTGYISKIQHVDDYDALLLLEKTWWHKGGRWLKQSGGDPSYGILLRPVESFDVSGEAQTNPDPAGVEAEDNNPCRSGLH